VPCKKHGTGTTVPTTPADKTTLNTAEHCFFLGDLMDSSMVWFPGLIHELTSNIKQLAFNRVSDLFEKEYHESFISAMERHGSVGMPLASQWELMSMELGSPINEVSIQFLP